VLDGNSTFGVTLRQLTRLEGPTLEGFAYVSTNRIASEANVNIGSLYQYFANCESIALAVYEAASSRAASTMRRRALQSFSLPIEQSVALNIEWVFDVFEKDRYALLQLINEIPDLRKVSQPFSFESLIHHPTEMFLQQHFTEIDRTVLARKAHVINKCVIGFIGRYFEEQANTLTRAAAVAELTQVIQRYVMTLAE
jgi:AcrR family transcriptional regulator